jgi:hypothetical protein
VALDAGAVDNPAEPATEEQHQQDHPANADPDAKVTQHSILLLGASAWHQWRPPPILNMRLRGVNEKPHGP